MGFVYLGTRQLFVYLANNLIAMKTLRLLLFILLPMSMLAQTVVPIELFQQFNGRYDYVAFGATLNIGENTGGDPPTPCEVLEVTSADLSLEPDQTLVAALLYWAGSGEGDFDITLNGVPITAERTFAYTMTNGVNTYFAAYADVTQIVEDTGNGTYTLEDLVPDLDPDLYCGPNGNTTNFGGWAVHVIYEDPDLPLNQINVFDGMDGVFLFNPFIEFELTNLNVLDNVGAKIGFLAWEGDAGLANNETLSINGNILSNEPLNPANNAFNGTNSFTGSSEFYNMDIDFYNIENNIQPGDESATIRLTSNQDLVMINNIITVLNNELPDATISIDQVTEPTECGELDITLDYTVYNVNSTDELPAGVLIGFYAGNNFIDFGETTQVLPIGGQESGTIELTLPEGLPADFLLRAFVDPDDTVVELNENNNDDSLDFHIFVIPEITGLVDLELCDVFGEEFFDLTEATAQIDPINSISYHLSEEDANAAQNPLTNINNYQNSENPETIWIRVFNPDCFAVGSFNIEVIVCPLPDAQVSIIGEVYACRDRDLEIAYRVSNEEGTAPLPEGTVLTFYLDNSILVQTQTQEIIPEGEDGFEVGSVMVTLTEEVPEFFLLTASIDDDGTGVGQVQELNEFNNEYLKDEEFGTVPPIGNLPDLVLCDEGFNMATFDLLEIVDDIPAIPNQELSFFTTEENATLNQDAISDPSNYVNAIDPQRIFVRQENEVCFTVGFFNLTTENCEPRIYEGMSPNGDGSNDAFIIEGLVNVYENFVLQIYSRDGNIIYEGGNEDGLWDGIPNTGWLNPKTIVPTGTYFYVLHLNDAQFPDPYIGDIYVNY